MSLAALRNRLDKLEILLPPPPKPDPEREKRKEAVIERLDNLIEATSKLMTSEHISALDAGIEHYGKDAYALPFGPWLKGLLDDGESRIPELPPETMKALLLAWMSPGATRWPLVCLDCGLCIPQHQTPPISQWKLLPGKTPNVGEPPWYDLPRFFERCPYCGVRPTMPQHRVLEQHYPWMDKDGYV